MEAENSDSSAPAREPEQASLGDDEMAAGGASKFLTNLPSRGLFSSAVLSSNLGSMRVYVCDHDTSPPEEQLIKTNATNILIRSLQINKLRIDSKDAKASVAITKDLLQDLWMENLQPKEPTLALLLAVVGKRDQVLGFLRECFRQ
ncbi:uncharacterized protein LOC110096453 isoform X2 [Dendrobium catenatum]|uniref:uncharacterized protein LOC110096453 isoform X2 n=1 Tax=Dendrobium catenatum TaxID=906689 RepID=UPI00109F287D|nr:uncharacterized protein LOC110096453 isoform X2 [Dendrobium catenatum]